MATVCKLCGTTAASKKNLKRHMRLRHPDEKKKKKSKRGKYAKRPYHKQPVATSRIESAVSRVTQLKPTIVGESGQPGVVVNKDGAVEKLRTLADGFQRKADLLRIMASELERI